MVYREVVFSHEVYWDIIKAQMSYSENVGITNEIAMVFNYLKLVTAIY
jgi:hypothetical protein